jgi:hypothetical protein
MARMAERVAQDRVNLGCFWSLAIGWAVLSWLWTFFPGGYTHSSLYDEISVGAIFLSAIYFTIERWRFPDATLVFDAPPVPGHAFRGKVETPLKNEPLGEPSSPIRVRVRAFHYVRKATGTVWATKIDAHPMRGERGIVVPIEITIPAELAAEGSMNWQITMRRGLYRARFFLARTPR